MKKKQGKKREKKQEIVITVQQQEIVPTADELSQPIRDGKNLTIPKTWLDERQLGFMLQSTPKHQIYKRPGRGGKEFDYVTGSYITKALNFVFAWNWDFEVMEHGKEKNHVWVLGKLTVRGMKPGQQISKTQFGRSEIKFKRDTQDHVDYGNDLKAATTDALKKCASMLGFASDVYGKMEYKMETGKQVHEAPAKVQLTSNVHKSKMLPGQITGPDGKPTYVCSNCAEVVTDQIANYSMKMYKKRLCRNCQPKK